jgi:hypothetical protein
VMPLPPAGHQVERAVLLLLVGSPAETARIDHLYLRTSDSVTLYELLRRAVSAVAGVIWENDHVPSIPNPFEHLGTFRAALP